MADTNNVTHGDLLREIQEINRTIGQINQQFAEIEKSVAQMQDVVRLTEGAKVVGRFAKWLSAVTAAAVIVLAFVKGFIGAP